MNVYAVVDDALSANFPLGVELEVFLRREDAERFIEEVRGDEPEIATKLRIEERELEAGGLKLLGYRARKALCGELSKSRSVNSC